MVITPYLIDKRLEILIYSAILIPPIEKEKS